MVPTLLQVFGGALTSAIMLGVAVDSGRVVSKEVVDLYESKLGSWILVQILHLMVFVPILGSLIASFYPVIVGVAFLLGGAALGVFL